MAPNHKSAWISLNNDAPLTNPLNIDRRPFKLDLSNTNVRTQSEIWQNIDEKEEN